MPPTATATLPGTDKTTLDESVDGFVREIRGLQPSFVPKPNGHLICLSEGERSLLLLLSLAKRKRVLSEQGPDGYSWNDSYEQWHEEGYDSALRGRVEVDRLAGEIRRHPTHARREFCRQYSAYLNLLYGMIDGGPIPEEVWLMATGSDGLVEYELLSHARRLMSMDNEPAH